jgi:hypothetical protein
MQSTYFGQKHPLNPFEDIKPIEELTQKYDHSLFAFCSHNKKRPNNVVLGTVIFVNSSMNQTNNNLHLQEGCLITSCST